jgi:hypothetical protein
VLSDDEYAVAEYNDIVRKRFVRGLDALLDGYKVRYHAAYNRCPVTYVCALGTVYGA